MTPPDRELLPDELYWHTVAIGLTAVVTNSLEYDQPLYKLEMRGYASFTPFLDPLQPLLQALVRKYRKVRFCDRVCRLIERRIVRAVHRRADALPRPIPRNISFWRNGRRVLGLDVPNCDARLEPKRQVG